MHLNEIRSCLITGATSGIGKALALEMGKKKIPLLLTGRNEEELKKLKNETGAEIFIADLSNLSSGRALQQWIDEKNPNLQIHNAGYGLKGPFENLSDQQVIEMITTNCTALALQTGRAMERWKKRQEKGIVLNIASVVGHFPMPYSALYAATKAFVRNLSLSVEGESHPNIKILTSCPGPVATDFFRRSSGEEQARRGGIMPVEVAVNSIIHQIQTEKTEVIFDWKYSLFTRISSKFLPLSFFRYIGSVANKKSP